MKKMTPAYKQRLAEARTLAEKWRYFSEQLDALADQVEAGEATAADVDAFLRENLGPRPTGPDVRRNMPARDIRPRATKAKPPR